MISGVSCAAEAAARQVLSNLGLAYSEKGDFDNSARYYRDAYWQVQLLCARLAAEQLVQLSGFSDWISQLAVRRAVKLAFPGRTMSWQNNLHSSLHVSWHGSWLCQIFLLADILIFAFR